MALPITQFEDRMGRAVLSRDSAELAEDETDITTSLGGLPGSGDVTAAPAPAPAPAPVAGGLPTAAPAATSAVQQAASSVSAAAPQDTWGMEYEAQPVGDGTYTISQIPNVQLPPGFNWQDYVSKNPDLQQVGIDTQAEAERHYRLYGHKETRAGAPDMSVQDAINFAKNNLNNQNAFMDAGEAGLVPTAIQVGKYSIAPVGYGQIQGFDIGGMGGTTSEASQLAPAGTPFEQIIRTDASGNVIGQQLKLKTGSDSGFYIDLDAQGRITAVDKFDESEWWRKPVGLAATFLGATLGAPGIGQALGFGTGTLGTIAGGAALGGLGGIASGAEGANLLKSMALGGIGAAGSQLATQAGSAVQSAVGPGLAGEVLGGAARGLVQAAPTAIATGDTRGLGVSALVGGLSAGAQSALKDVGFTPNQIRGASNLALQAFSDKPNINSIINAVGDLIDSPNATVAAKSAVLFNLARSGADPMRIIGAAQDLYGSIERASVPKGLSDAATAAFINAKRTGATDDEAAAAAQAVSGGTVGGISRLPGTVPSVTTSVTGDNLGTVGPANFDIGDINSIELPRAPTKEELNASIANGINNAATFEDAYATARNLYGAGKTFTWQGKSYSTDTRQENPALAEASDLARVNAATSVNQTAGAGRGLTAGAGVDAATSLSTVPLRTTIGATSSGDVGTDFDAVATSMQGTQLSDQFKPIVADPQWVKDHLQTGGNVVRQGFSNLFQLLGEQGSSIVTGLGGRNTFIDRAFTALETAGKNMELPQVTQATQNVLSRVQNTEGFFNKGFEFVKAVIDNPLSLNMVLREVGQEVLPVAAAARATKLLGLAAGVATDVGLNTVEAIGATSRDKYQEYIKQGKSPEEADRLAARDGYIAGAITAVTAGIVDSAIAKRFGSAIESAVGRKAGAGVAEAPVEGFEELAIALATGEDLNSAFTKSIVGAGVGGKTASTIQTSVDVNTALANSFADQGLVSIDGSYRPDSVVDASLAIGTDPSGKTLTLGDLVTSSLANEDSHLSTTGQMDVNQLISDYSREVLGGGVIDTSGMAADTVLGTSASGTPITAASLGLVSGGATTGSEVDTATGLVTNTAVNNTGGTTVTATNSNTGATNTTETNAATNTVTTSSSNPNSGTETVVQTNNNTGASTTTTNDNNAGTTTTVTSDPGSDTKTQVTTNQNTGVATESVTDTSTGVTKSTDTSADTGATTQTVTNANTGTSNSTTTDPSTNTTTNSQTDGATNTTISTETNNNTGATTETTTDANNNTTTSSTTDTNTGVNTQTTTDNNTGVTTSTATDTNTGVTTETQTNTNTGVTTQTQTDTNTGTTTQTQTDTNTGVTTQTTTDTNTGVTTETTTDTSTGVNTQTTTDTSTGTTTETTTDTSTGVTTQTTTDTTTGVTTETQTDSNITTQTQTDTNTGVTTQTQTDTNTGVTTQTTTDTNTGTTTNTTTDTNTGVTTQITTNENTGVTTETNTNVNTGITTQTTTDGNITTNTTTDTNSGQTITVVTDTTTGRQMVIGDDLPIEPLTPIKPLDPVKPVTSLDPIKGVDPVKSVEPVAPITPPDVKTPTVKPPSTRAPAAAMALPAFYGGAQESGSLAPQMLESRVTQGYVDPLAQVRQAQEQFERDAMMQNIDPRLMQILSERMGAPQGGLDQAANEQPYYSYGQEDSIDDILGGPLPEAVNYAEGGYVEPLKAKGGGMALPILAKSGGLPSHQGGREDFKGGKHVAGEGDGQSDDIPAWLADGEFVFPADVVSALGNGSTKAGTDKLYEMMHNIRERARSKGPKDLPPPALKSPLDYLKSKR